MAEKMKTNELVEPVAEELPVNTPEPEGQPLPVDGEVPEVETPSAPAPEDSGTGKNDNLKKLEKYVLQFNPDADVSTPDAIIASAVPLFESIISFHDDLNEVVEEFPEFGDFIIGLRKGFSPQEAAARYLDIEGIMPPEGADDFDAVQKAKAERRKQVDKRKAWETKLPENQKVTSKNFAAVVKELGLDEATQQSIVDNLEAILKDAKDGIISADHWKMLANGLRHETVVAEKDKEMEMAVEDAKIAGRNEQIKKKRINKDTGDGLPKLTNSGVAPTKPKKSQLIPSKKEFRV